MSSSDIIAIVAITVSGLASIVTTVVAYLINRSNNKAKRSEITLEKRLEALRAIYEQLSALDNELYTLSGLYIITKLGENDEETNNFEKIYQNNQDASWKQGANFQGTYHKYRVYIPAQIDKKLQRYINDVLQFDVLDSDTHQKASSLSRTYLREITEAINTFIGDR